MGRPGVMILAAIGCIFAVPLAAETLQMGGTENAARFEHEGKPRRGMSQASVEASWGAPQTAHAPVGDPPITRWEYAEFVVFFEYDRVIHSVSRR